MFWGAHRLFLTDGRALPHAETAMTLSQETPHRRLTPGCARNESR